MIIQFKFNTEYGVFSDALNLPDDHGITDEQLELLKQQRVDNWIAVITAPAEEPAPEEPVTEEPALEEPPMIEAV